MGGGNYQNHKGRQANQLKYTLVEDRDRCNNGGGVMDTQNESERSFNNRSREDESKENKTVERVECKNC